MMKLKLAAMTLGVALLALTPVTAAAAVANIVVAGTVFVPTSAVSPGTVVSIQNVDPLPHTVTSDSPGLFHVVFGAGSTSSFTAPSVPGQYLYHCNLHAWMHGVLVVQ